MFEQISGWDREGLSMAHQQQRAAKDALFDGLARTARALAPGRRAEIVELLAAYIMSHRTQITLTDAQYERLRTESERTGVGLAELVRRALDRSYGSAQHDKLLEGLEDSFGSWIGRDYDESGYVDGLRRGMARRLADA